MLVAFFLIAQISHDIPHNWQGNGRPLALFFVFFSVSCLLYFVSIFALTRHSKIPKPRIKPLLGLFLLGLAFRLAFVGSEPILEDDTFRYLWDGALLANGSNPFVYPPLTFLDEANFTDLPESVASLAKSGANTLQQINYPDLTTVYPPVAQLWFAFSYWVSPWSFEAWRGLLILTECLGFVFLILAIRRMGKLTLWGLIYWWNPMVILQFSNGLHVDAVLTSFLFLALYLLLSGRAIPACLPLLAAVGIKLWPIILLPFFLKEFWNRKALFFSLTIAFTVGTALLVSPLLLFQAETVGNGLETYSHLWQMNDGIYTIVHKFSWSMTKFWNEDPIQSWRSAHTLARIVIVSILGLFILYRFLTTTTDRASQLSSMLLVSTVLFLLSPTVFPWYYPWMLVFVVFCPRPSFLILTATLSLYYLRYYFVFWGREAVYDTYLVWLQFIPVLILFVIEQRHPNLKDLSTVQKP